MQLIGPALVPCLADQAAARGWPFGFYSFPDASPLNEYFNPAIVEWGGKTWLIVRRRQGKPGVEGLNSLEAWQVDPADKLSRRTPLLFNNAPRGARDPRAFARGEALIISFCEYLEGGFAHQAMVGVRPGFVVEPLVHVKAGFNGESCETATGHEKNWTPFAYDGSLCVSYSLSDARHIVIQTRSVKAVKAFYSGAPTWQWGPLRGGSCPILVDGLFWTFFHSHTAWYCLKRRYHMGALAFESTPPFNVVRMSRKPLLSGSELDYRSSHAPPCVWPGGALLRDGVWTVSLGVNDNACAWVKVLHSDVEKACYTTC